MDIGLISLIIAELPWATEIVFIRKFFPTANSLFLAAVGSIIGSLFYLPILFTAKVKFSSNNWIIIIIYAFTSWFLAQLFYVSGIQKSSNSIAVTFAVLSLPLFTLILSAFFLKEVLTLKAIIGGLIMIIGFLVISF